MKSDPRSDPAKAKDIGQKQLRALANLPLSERLDQIAAGLPILLKSAETLFASREPVGATSRIGQILRGHAREEAAKILILLDYVRCPPGLSDRAQRQLSVFYDHGSRLIYAQACSWKPVDVDMLRSYVDQQRGSHYVEGEYGELILPNWELYIREARLYADLTRTDSGALVWNDPDAWADDLDVFGFPPTVLSVARSLSRMGVFSREGLGLVHDIWPSIAFRSVEDHAQSKALIQETLERLIKAGLPADEATDDDVRMLYSSWQLPMYDIDTRMRSIELAELRAEQQRQVRDIF